MKSVHHIVSGADQLSDEYNEIYMEAFMEIYTGVNAVNYYNLSPAAKIKLWIDTEDRGLYLLFVILSWAVEQGATQ